MTWLKHQGADTVADLNQLPPGTYTCKDLADGLGMPMLKAQRLLSALEGTKSSAIHPDVCAARCTTGAQQPHSPQPAAPVRSPPKVQYSERPV
jgi:hypothetical protein